MPAASGRAFLFGKPKQDSPIADIGREVIGDEDERLLFRQVTESFDLQAKPSPHQGQLSA
jgi:hypothetical protein